MNLDIVGTERGLVVCSAKQVQHFGSNRRSCESMGKGEHENDRHGPRNYGGCMTFRNDPNWNRLVGVFVEIRCQGRTIRTGIVDDAMPDSSALWIAAHGVQPRTIYEAALGYEAWWDLEQLREHAWYWEPMGDLTAQDGDNKE